MERLEGSESPRAKRFLSNLGTVLKFRKETLKDELLPQSTIVDIGSVRVVFGAEPHLSVDDRYDIGSRIVQALRESGELRPPDAA